MIWENLKMAGRSIATNKLRTFLTMLGIIIGVGAVVSINSIGQGVKQLVTNQVSGLGANVIVVTPGQIGGHGGGGFSSGIGTSTLTPQDVTTIQHNRHVSTVAPLSVISAIVAQGTTQDPSSIVIATTPNFLSADPSQKIDSGRFLNAADVNANVTVLSSDARDTLFGKGAAALGKTIAIRAKSFTVIGVLQAPAGSQGGSFGASTQSDVYIPTGAAETLTGTSLQVFRILAQAKSNTDVQPAVDSSKAAIKKNHGGQEDFSVLTQKDILSTLNTILTALTSAISAIAAISLLVGGIGIMNIMLVSVTERTREIGLRKALGATSGMVLSQFLIEAVVVTLLGGLIGLGLAYLGGKGIAHLAHFTPIITTGTVATAFIVSALVGIIFGIAPAIKAARMRPIDALRYE